MSYIKKYMENLNMNLNPTCSYDFIKRNIHKAEFGLEKESLRITCDGFLSHTKHPLEEQPNITRDFCENQIELITGVFDNPKDVLHDLEQLQAKVLQVIRHLKTGKELLWPFSNPPYLKGEDDIPIAQFEGAQKEKTEYRNYLAKKYGKKKMLFSGIHLNYSFSDEMLREYYPVWRMAEKARLSEEKAGLSAEKAELLAEKAGLSAEKTGLRGEEERYQEYKNRIYLQMAQKTVKYTWFIVYLMAAGAIMDASFFDRGENIVSFSEKNGKKKDMTRYASVRCGKDGYWNDFVPVFDYENMESYLGSIESYVKSGTLKSVSELYYPVRLKPKGENSLERFRMYGVNHIELRMLDINPFSPVGIGREDLEFLHYFMLYLFCQSEISLTKEEQLEAVRNEKAAAEFDDTVIFIREDGKEKPIREAVWELLEDIDKFYQSFGESSIQHCIQYQKEKLSPGKRYAERIQKEFGTDYVKKGILLAENYADQLIQKLNV
jgi:glutamate--cysteine ligase